MITRTEAPFPAYGIYGDGHSECLGDYRFAFGLPSAVRAYAIWDQQPFKLQESLRYIVVFNGGWCVCGTMSFGGSEFFKHHDLDAALMWGRLNL